MPIPVAREDGSSHSGSALTYISERKRTDNVGLMKWNISGKARQGWLRSIA